MNRGDRVLMWVIVAAWIALYALNAAIWLPTPTKPAKHALAPVSTALCGIRG